MKKILTSIFILFLSLNVFSQDYTHVDDKVKNYPKQFRSVEYLAARINKDFTKDIDKIRALYFWLSNNISYDYESLNKEEKSFKVIKSKSEDDYQRKLKAQELKYANKCLKRGKAVCEGYSQIFRFTSDLLKIKSVVINGYAKTSTRQIGKIRNSTNHAWNAVKIDNKWQLIDATWSSGNSKKKFNDSYFLIAPEKLILSHLPKNSKWQLLKKPVKKAEFFYYPIFYPKYHKSTLELSKNQGLLKAKQNETIRLTFKTVKELDKYYYAIKGNSTSKIVFKKVKDVYVTDIPFNSKRNTELILFSETKGIIGFKILVSK